MGAVARRNRARSLCGGIRIQQTRQLGSEGLRGLLKLSDLQRLSLGENPQLGDDAAAIISELPTLRSLDLLRASITDEGMTAITRLPRLENLTITATKVTDRGLANLAQVSTLRSLWAESCPISIVGLRELSQLPLTRLEVGSGYSQVMMSDVTEIAAMFPRLVSLDCRFKGSSPAGLSPLVALKDLRDLMITPDLLVAGEPHHLARFPALKRLRFWNLELNPEAMAQVRLIPQLDELFLQESRINDETLSILAESPNIRILSLYDWTGGDAELLKLADMPALKRIDLSSTQVTAEGAAHFHELRPDVSFGRDFRFTGQTK